MKHIKRVTIAIIVFQIIAIGLVMGNSVIQDMTLATDGIYLFDENWIMHFENGDEKEITQFPYNDKCNKDEIVIAKNIIPDYANGKTLSFLSADKTLKIYVGEELIYTFGNDDIRKVGHTPGSVMVFADIPENSTGKEISIEMQSHYNNYATYMTEMIVASRDVAILTFLKKNLSTFVSCIGILVCGIIILIFAVFQKYSREEDQKLYGLGLFLLALFSFNMIETKMLMIFLGNQFLYSNLVFISLFLAPFFLGIYVYQIVEKNKAIFRGILIIICMNIIMQTVLQLLNVFDFLEMAFMSHALLAIVYVILLIYHLRHVIKNKKLSIECIGCVAMTLGCFFDLVRSHTQKVGDLGKYGRIGVLVFGICSIIAVMRKMVREQVQAAEDAKMEVLSSEIIQVLVTAIDAKDIYTKGHSTRVADYAVILAKELGWDNERIKSIRYKALLHDVGKIGIPDRVLNKADRLTEEEFEIIKAHTTVGADILHGVSSLSDIGQVAKSHHERYDGKGYPEGKIGTDIPEEARIVGIADSYDAMSSDRAYRKALSKDVIRAEVVRGRGTQFDPEITDVFLRLFDEGKFDVYANESIYEDVIHLKDVIGDLQETNRSNGAIKINIDDMSSVYQYIEGLHKRLGIDYHTILISLDWEKDVAMEDVSQAMQAMEYSIHQSLRKVDVMARVSESQYLVILTEAQTHNIKMIIERISTAFYKNCLNTKIKPEYETK